MPIATSAVPAVKRKLVEVLQTDAAIAAEQLQVTYGYPDEQLLERAGIIVAAGSGRNEWGGLGAQRREQELTVRVVCHASVLAASQAETEERAYEIAALTETALMTDPTLGGLILMPGGVTQADDHTDRVDDGYATTVVLQFTGTARLTNT